MHNDQTVTTTTIYTQAFSWEYPFKTYTKLSHQAFIIVAETVTIVPIYTVVFISIVLYHLFC
jgi:hypothetical protein